ncbi:MAG: anaerobic ribonucleoside-triphosphate reductase [Patescibacteria group bacterium]
MDSLNSAVGCEGQATLPERTRCEVWTRVMGYHRPVAYFNIGKKSEHYSRKHFDACVDGNSAFSAQYAPATAALC